MRRFLLFFVVIVIVPGAYAGELPPYLKEALAHFSPAIPADWAYTIATQRDNESSVERFDPSRPLEQQWTLLQRDHRPSTVEENSRYSSYRISTAPSTHATFGRGDIDLGTAQLVSENDRQALFRFRFREDLDDQMLRMLELELTVVKQPAYIEQFSFRLAGPYSPVLAVKMLELRVETMLSPPAEDHPGLPLRTTSRFRGRVLLFKHVEEDIQTAYSDFTRVKPLSSRPSGSQPSPPP